MAKIRANTKDWLAVAITTNRKMTNRQGRNRGEGFRRKRRMDGVRLLMEKEERVKGEEEGGTEKK